MFSLGGIASVIAGPLVDTLIGKGTELFKAYLNKQISVEELRTALIKVVVEAFADIEKSHAEALTKTYESFQQTLRTSPELVRMFKVVVYSQTFVLLWHQWFIPFYLYFFAPPGARYPSSGTTAEWAYLLLGGLCGLAPMVLRAGPGAGDIAGSLKRLIGK